MRKFKHNKSGFEAIETTGWFWNLYAGGCDLKIPNDIVLGSTDWTEIIEDPAEVMYTTHMNEIGIGEYRDGGAIHKRTVMLMKNFASEQTKGMWTDDDMIEFGGGCLDVLRRDSTVVYELALKDFKKSKGK